MTTKYAELVAAEAEGLDEDEDEAAAEADEAAEPTEPEPDTDEPTELDTEAQQASAQALVKKLDSENTRHAKTLARLMEVDVKSLVECEQCASYGFLPPGQSNAPDFLPDPQMGRCDRCDGRGMTLTGAQPPGETTYQCSQCGGRGWITITPMPEVAAYPPPPPTVVQNGPVAPPGYVLVPTGV